MAHPHPSQREKFWELSYCTLRDIRIRNPFWTYCHNFQYGKHLPKHDEERDYKGWVLSSGLYEGYVRIPWHGDSEPEVSKPCTCAICGRITTNGIIVRDDMSDIGFCTNRHYIDWWKAKHDDPQISSEGLDTPEEHYKETQ
jgi:hypothetical protein